MHDIVDEGCQLGSVADAVNDLVAADIQHGHDGAVEQQRHDGADDDDQIHGLEGGVQQLAADAGELFLFLFLAHERFDNAHVGKIFLYRAVDIVHAGLHPGEQWHRGRHDGNKRDEQQRHHNIKDARQPRIEPDGHDQRQRQHDRHTHQHTQAHDEGVLDLVHIVGHAGAERGDRKIVDILERKGLHLAENGGAQAAADPDAGLGRKHGVADGKQQRQHRKAEHGEAGAQDIIHAAGLQPLTGDIGHQKRQIHFEQRVADNAENADDDIADIGLDIFCEGFHAFSPFSKH